VLAVATGGDVVAATGGAAVVVNSGDVAVVLSAVEMLEEKVFVQLQKSEDLHDAKIWILDTGGTNHMSGSDAAFANLNTHV
jgi:aspartate 1-decarboxylase